MPSVSEATDALRSALHKKRVESHVQDVFNHLSTCLVLLNSSSPSVQMIRKLCTVLRRPLLPLYKVCLPLTLQLASSVLSTVLEKLCDAHSVEDEMLRSAWDATAEVILSGILDFLDQKDGGNVGSDGPVWEGLYRIICNFFFLDSGRGLPVLSLQLRLSAYNTLTETAARHITVQNALRHAAVLGGEKLGAAISRTRDYLLLEALLMLFARLLPPVHNTSQGKLKRAKFVKEVLGSPNLFQCSTKLLEIMHETSSTHWDDVASQIVDTLARSDITYPQPFSIDDIDICGHVFPQPLATDRLIMDKQAFLANVIVEDNDQCESLQVPYSHIHTITLDPSAQNVPKEKVVVMVYLTSPPLVGNAELKSLNGILHAKFILQNDVVGRFMEALRRRGMGKLRFLNPLKRKRKSISIGSGVEFMDDGSPVPPIAAFEGKVQLVNQVYKTDMVESEAVPVPQVGGEDFLTALDPQPAFKDDILLPDVLESTVVENTPETPRDATLISSTKKSSTADHNSTFPLSRGNSIGLFDDELSEISEFELENETVNERMENGVSVSCNHKLKQTQRDIDPEEVHGSSSTTSAIGFKKSPESALKTGCRPEEFAQRTADTKESLLTSTSPTSAPSSSTQVDVSPKAPLSTNSPFATVGTEITGGPLVSSQNFLGTDKLKLNNSGADECGSSTAGFIVVSTGKAQTGFNSIDGFREHDSHLTPSFDANQKGHTVNEIMKDETVLPKIFGNRRKRETVKSSSTVILEVDDEFTPPRKKSRHERRILTKSNETSSIVESVSMAKRRTKPLAGSSPGTYLTMVDFDELSEIGSTHQGTRRSSRIKRQTEKKTRARVNVVRGRTQKVNQADGPSVTATRESPSAKLENEPFMELSGNIPPETSPSQEILQTGSKLLCEPSQPSVTPTKEPRRNLDFFQATTIDEQFYVKHEESMDDKFLEYDCRTVDNDVHAFLEESVVPVECLRPIMPQTESAAIDLTSNSPPSKEKSEPRKASNFTPTKPRTSDHLERIVVEKPVFDRSSGRKRRSVTFASPIEHVLDKKVNSKDSSSNHRSPSPSESNILSPLMISTKRVHTRRESPGRITPQFTLTKSRVLQASAHDQTKDEVDIQDIVEVLDEIQAVIIKGISNRFRNIRKDVQHGRDELIRQVLDGLQGMVFENARTFNGLVRLEEDYCKNGQAITRSWEDLIDCNDGIAIQFRNALTEHDQNVSAKTFPRSLLSMKPVFLCRRANA